MTWTEKELAQRLKDNPDLNISESPNGKIADFESAKANSTFAPVKPHSKYHSLKTEYNGRIYPSKRQAENAAKFMALVGKGKPYKAYLEEIPFRLPGGSQHRVDHLLLTWNDTAEWYETKGRDLPMGMLKRKQTEEIYHIRIRLI